MKAYDISKINARLLLNARAVVDECEREQQNQMEQVAHTLKERTQSGVVLLAGPSGAGKTTSALKLARELTKQGRPSRPLSMDDYFLSLSDRPLTLEELADIDLECPSRLDLSLLTAHLDDLRRGRSVQVPTFDFTRQQRAQHATPFSPPEGGAVVVEGIHALNPAVTGEVDDGVYVDAGVQFILPDGKVMQPSQLRLLRRLSRDMLYRGRPMTETLQIGRAHV